MRNPLKTLLAVIVALSTVAAAVFAYLTWRDTARPELVASVVVNRFEMIPHFDSLSWRLQPGLDSTGGLKNTDPWGFFGVGTLLDITITNNGSEDAENVRAHIPGGVYWCVRREGKQRECAATKDVFSLAVLAPRESATMQVWGSDLLLSTPSSIRVSHKRGIGRVELRTVELPSKRGSVDVFVIGYALSCTLIVLGFALDFFVKEYRSRRQSR